MKRAGILLGVLMVVPAWCDEARTEPERDRASFDLTNPQVRKALRKTVATQVGQYVLAPAKYEPEPAAVEYVTPEQPAARPPARYSTSLPSPKPEADGVFSTIVNALINDVLLDAADHERDYREHQDPKVACTARGDDLGSTTCDRADATPRTPR